jgi:phosphoribosylformimino-5-aminoimidazole carboxamide ribotide isomerase
MTLFRPCIDLHQGRVKQIVGGTLTDGGARENFVSERPASWYAARYKEDGLLGGHVILLGPGNELAATEALAAYPGGLQVGGGITPENARLWLERGASKVIVTSFLFEGGEFREERLDELLRVVKPEELVVDLSCRKVDRAYRVATNRWQTVTETVVDESLFSRLHGRASEILVHAADVEGLCRGIDEELVRNLGHWTSVPCTYAGGARSLDDLSRVEELSQGKVDLTIGSALDMFGGTAVRYEDCVAWNRARS